jgi:hypothetical protein
VRKPSRRLLWGGLLVILLFIGIVAVLILGGIVKIPGINDGSLVVNQTSDPQRTYHLEGGRYELSWSHQGCTEITIAISSDTGFQYEDSTRLPSFTRLLRDMPTGEYRVEQRNAECGQWEIRLRPLDV